MKKFFASILLFFVFASTSFAITSEEYSKAGIALYQKGQLDMAVQYLRAAVLSDPQNWQAYQTLGNCLHKQNKSQEALEAYDKSLALHPDNPAVKTFADELRKQPAAPAAPSVPGLPAIGNSPREGDLYANALFEAQSRIRAGGSNPQDHPLLTNFYAGKIMEEKSREGLKLEGQNRTQTVEEKYIGRYGASKSDFFEPHATFDFGILTPTGINFDLGFFLEPTKNLGLAFAYLPMPITYYSYGAISVPRDLIYLEPRIKFYSAPGGLTTYHGFSLIYFAFHQGVEPDGYQGSSFDIIGLGYMFGFRTLPMDGMTMELGWKMGAAAIFLTDTQYVYTSYTYPYTYSYIPVQRVIPFPYIIPEFRFGFTF